MINSVINITVGDVLKDRYGNYHNYVIYEIIFGSKNTNCGARMDGEEE